MQPVVDERPMSSRGSHMAALSFAKRSEPSVPFRLLSWAGSQRLVAYVKTTPIDS
jgi:hypothetical protein